jgi:hypothetical protein
MPLDLTAPITQTVTATGYQITQIGATFYDGGGPLEACTLAIRGRKGTGDGAEFVTLPGDAGRVDVDLRNAEAIAALAVPVASLPQDKTLMEALLGIIDVTLKAKGNV